MFICTFKKHLRGEKNSLVFIRESAGKFAKSPSEYAFIRRVYKHVSSPFDVQNCSCFCERAKRETKGEFGQKQTFQFFLFPPQSFPPKGEFFLTE